MASGQSISQFTVRLADYSSPLFIQDCVEHSATAVELRVGFQNLVPVIRKKSPDPLKIPIPFETI